MHISHSLQRVWEIPGIELEVGARVNGGEWPRETSVNCYSVQKAGFREITPGLSNERLFRAPCLQWHVVPLRDRPLYNLAVKVGS